MHTAGLIVVRVVFPGAMLLGGALVLWYGVLVWGSDPVLGAVMTLAGGAVALLSLYLLWWFNNARGRARFRWHVLPEDEEDAAPPLSEEERKRLTRELDEVERRWRDALEAGFFSGGSLGAHEVRADLEERAAALRARLGVPAAPWPHPPAPERKG